MASDGGKWYNATCTLCDRYRAGQRWLVRRLAWLHLSDLHWTLEAGSQGHNRQVVLEALLSDIRDRAEKIDASLASLDFVVISGDIAFSGQQAEYDAAAERFLLPLADAAGLPGAGSGRRVLAVPGNHDVDRSGITAEARRLGAGARARDDVNDLLLDARNSGLLMQRQAAYRDFFARWSPGVSISQPGGFYVVRIQAGCGPSVAIMGLNTSWLAEGGESDRGRLALGEVQVAEALRASEGCDVRIAVMHHPLDWLLDGDRVSTEGPLARGCHFVLRGHTHRAGAVSRQDLFGHVIEVAAGASYDRRDFPNGYNFVSLDFDTGETTVYLRRWSDSRNEWVRDSRLHGRRAGWRDHPPVPREPGAGPPIGHRGGVGDPGGSRRPRRREALAPRRRHQAGGRARAYSRPRRDGHPPGRRAP